MSTDIRSEGFLATIVPRFKNGYKLFTHEDPTQLHKTLGIVSMLHFIYRFVRLLVTGSMGFDRSPFTFFFICLHVMLSVSSFIFRLPTKRNPAKPMIWPEFRWHSVIFACRSLLDMFYHWANVANHVELRVISVVVTMLVADYVTKYYKQLALVNQEDTTMRGMPFPKSFNEDKISWMNFYYGISQAMATIGVATVSRNRAKQMNFDFEASFFTLFGIQFAAFLMTCVRKSIITSGGWHFWYAFALGLNHVYLMYICTAQQYAMVVAAVTTFAVLRFRFRVNKYVLWGSFLATVCFLEPVLDNRYQQGNF